MFNYYLLCLKIWFSILATVEDDVANLEFVSVDEWLKQN